MVMVYQIGPLFCYMYDSSVFWYINGSASVGYHSDKTYQNDRFL